MAARKLTAEDLLKGAYYSVEQAGHLLNDAVSLFKMGRYPSAVVLAVLSQEELGREKILLDERSRVPSSGPVSIEDVIKKCKNHPKKIRRGRVGTTVKLDQETRKELFEGGYQSNEYKRAISRVINGGKAKKKREPKDLDEKRKDALYVGPKETGDWNRPFDMGREECREIVLDVAINYGLNRGQLIRDNRELVNALHKWKERPHFPPDQIDFLRRSQ